MKKTSKLLPIISLFLSVALHSQENNSITITPEVSIKIINENRLNISIFRVDFKEINFPIYEVGEIPSDNYLLELKKLEEYKDDFDTYQKKLVIAQKSFEEIKSISSKINKFINSKEKYNSKEYLLVEAQKIVTNYKLATEFKSGNINISNKIIYLYINGKRTKKKNLLLYKNYIDNLKLNSPDKSQGYREYMWQMQRLNSINKTMKGLVLSNKTQKKEIYIIEDTLSVNYKKFNGLFSILKNKFSIVLTNIPNKFIKNQIANENEFNSNTSLFSRSYNLIKRNDSDEYFLIINDEFLPILIKSQREQELLAIVRKLGYKEYEIDGDYYIKSKTCEIRLCPDAFTAFTNNPSWITELDNLQIKLLALAKQTVPHSKTLNKYAMQWKIQRRNMPTASINSWRAATIPAIKLSKQIYSLQLDDANNYYFTKLLDKSDTLEYFLDNVLVSRGVLGI